MELTIKMDTSKKDVRALLKYLKSLSIIEVIEKETSIPTDLLMNAITEVEEGDTTKIDGTDELSNILANAE